MIDDFHGSFPPLTVLEYEDIITDGDIGHVKDGLSKKNIYTHISLLLTIWKTTCKSKQSRDRLCSKYISSVPSL